jgi:pimeloyl-ACP methyl ester carboxylesterase
VEQYKKNREKKMPENKFFTGMTPSQFSKIHYREWGDEHLSPLICVHGLSRNGGDFKWLGESLADKYHTLAVDVPGRGLSEWRKVKKEYHPGQYVFDMNAMLNHLKLDQVDFLGTSMGGIMGMIMASMPGNPIKRLVLNDIGSSISGAGLRRISRYLKEDPIFETKEEGQKYLEKILKDFGDLSKETWNEIADNSLQKDGNKHRLSRDPGIYNYPFWVKWFGVNLEPIWDKVQCPVLILRGEKSDILTKDIAEKMVSSKPNVTLIEIPNVGHAPSLMIDSQIKVVKEWLG